MVREMSEKETLNLCWFLAIELFMGVKNGQNYEKILCYIVPV